MKKAVFLFLLLTIFVGSVFSLYQPDMKYSGEGEVIPVGSELYEKFDDLFLLEGHTSPSTARPWTVGEARVELSKIDSSKLSGMALKIYQEISEAIAEEKDYAVFLDIAINPEIYVHTNKDFDLEDDWNYGYVKRNPLLYAGVNAYHNSFAMHVELTYGISRFGDGDTLESLQNYIVNDLGKTYQGVGTVADEYWYSDELKDVEVVSKSAVYGSSFSFNGIGPSEFDTPRNAYLTYSRNGLSFGAYRAQKVWGRSRIGNFIYDDHVDKYHYVSAKVFNKRFAFDFSIMFPEASLGAKSWNKDYGDRRRFFLSHRFDIQIRDNMKFTLSENVMYLATSFGDFQYMNPATIYHNNINSGMFNALAHIEFEYAPCRGLQLYTQLGVDQGSVPFFEDSSTEDLSAGLTIGAEYAFEALDGLFDLNLEAVYATPALYRRAGSPDFIITTSSAIDIPGGYQGVPLFTYIGFKYGGDTLAFRFDSEYKRDALRIYANETLLFKGEFTMYDKYTSAMFVDTFLSGDVSMSSITDAGVEYSFSLFKLINCKAFLDACLIYKADMFDVQISCGLKSSYSGRR